VTIGVGFRCTNGVLICSDRQITSAAGFKTETRKISRTTSWERWLLFSYAGEQDASLVMFNKVREGFMDEFTKARSRNEVDKARAALEKIFTSRHAKLLQTLIAIRLRESGSIYLFRTSDHKVVEGQIEHIGGGDCSAVRYAADLLLNEPLTINEAGIIGSYLVSIASRYVDGCGGEADIAAIHQDGFIAEGSGGPFQNTSERFSRCEREIGERFKSILLSGAMG
jgi:hypothetical protein